MSFNQPPNTPPGPQAPAAPPPPPAARTLADVSAMGTTAGAPSLATSKGPPPGSGLPGSGPPPAMPGNDPGYLGWSAIYRVGDRIVVYFAQTGYDSGGPTIQGISILAEDAELMADQASRRAIKGYRFDPDLYALMIELDAKGKLSKYGSYFGGTPSPCYDLPEAERACTKGAYANEYNHTAAEIRADLVERFRGMDDPDDALAILGRDDSVTEIRA